MNRNELTLEEFRVCLHNSLYLHFMFVCMYVCMFDIYVVINKENHLDLHWTLSHMFNTVEPGYLRESNLFPHTYMVRSNASWLMVTWDTLWTE